MVPALRSKISCFYCGSRSKQIRTPQLRRWQCEQCEAVNHLDENGEITDPPAVDTSHNLRYAGPLLRQPSLRPSTPEAPIFCAKCLKNQHLYSEALASYFPSDDDPNYREYERAYPKFRKGLEERYPQTCVQCEPRVLGRLKDANYAAKADHLSRIMERTRPGVAAGYTRDWRRSGVFLGGLFWGASWAGQVVWDVHSIMNSENAKGGFGAVSRELYLTVLMYLSRTMEIRVAALVDAVDAVVIWALLLGLVSFWWNPRLQEKLDKGRVRGRVVGIGEFYKLQGLSLAMRYAAWAFLTSPNKTIEPTTSNAIHYCVLIFTVLLTVVSFRSIRMDYTPRVNFHDLTPERFVSQRDQPDSVGTTELKPNVTGQSFDTNEAPNGTEFIPFSIRDFAPQSPVSAPTLYRPLTPPDEDSDNAMDWTPSQPSSLPPAPLLRATRATTKHSQEPSPFHGHLPADIISPAHKLRNPPNQPTFRKASAAQKQKFFKPTATRSIRDDYSETSEPPSLSEVDFGDASPIKFADPKFFPEAERKDTTGLENLFSNIFTISEEPAEVRAAQQVRESNAWSASVALFARGYQLLVLLPILGIGVAILSFQKEWMLERVRGFGQAVGHGR